jgi:hypothetical protein
MNQQTNENNEKAYPEMLLELVEQFDELLPEILTFEDTIELGIEAWNLANSRKIIDDQLYEKELKEHKYKDVLQKMVEYKLEHFAAYDRIITDYTLEDDIFTIKTQTFMQQFDQLLSMMINPTPEKE